MAEVIAYVVFAELVWLGVCLAATYVRPYKPRPPQTYRPLTQAERQYFIAAMLHRVPNG